MSGPVSYPGYTVDAQSGVVTGPKGRAVGRARRHGYIKVRTSAGEVFLHRMVWQSVHGPIPEGREINHINGIKSDNRLANLELVTRGENIAHAYRLGLRRNDGEKNPRAKLTAAQVEEIRSSSESQRAIARRYGISRTHVKDIRSGKSWKGGA